MESQILERLKETVLEYDAKEAEKLARKAIEENIDPIQVADALTDAVKEVGDAFGRGDLWLPDLIGAAGAMKAAMPLINEEIKKRGKKRETVGKVVLGTVAGDIHDIGKTMVATLLQADGFDVIDLGVDIPADTFVEAIKEYRPNVLAMSALMTTTSPEQKKIIEILKEKGLREGLKILVGGGAITKEFAVSIGADGYGSTAVAAPKVARELLGR